MGIFIKGYILLLGLVIVLAQWQGDTLSQEEITLPPVQQEVVPEMKIVELLRREESKQGTVGILSINKEIFGFTLEPPDQENKSDISSIPTGQYVCKPYTSKRWGTTWEVTDVTNRTYILFHPGNLVSHTAGCILLGDKIKKLKGDRVALNSGATFKEFLELMEGEEEFHLTIREEY